MGLPGGGNLVAEKIHVASLAQPQEHSQADRLHTVAHGVLTNVFPCPCITKASSQVASAAVHRT